MKTPFETRHRNLLIWLGILSPLIVWYLISSLELISQVFLANPVDVAISLYKEIVSGTLIIEIGYTLFRTILGFLLGSTLGVTIGILLSTNKTFLLLFTPLIEFLRSIPVLCLFPLFLLFFGIGNVSKIMIAGWSSFFIVIIPTIYGVTHIPKIKITTAKLFGASKQQMFFDVIIPASIPEIIGGLRIGIAIALIAVVVTEMFTGTQHGIGRYIFDSGLVYDTAKMYAGILTAGMLGLIINKVFTIIENDVIHWRVRI